MSKPANPYLSLRLKPGREYPILKGHPWVFSGAFQTSSPAPEPGDTVRLESDSGEFIALAHFWGGSLACKVLTLRDELIDGAFYLTRIEQALNLRKGLGLLSSSEDESTETNAFRLVNGEGDGLPGLVIDRYGKTVVLQFHSLGMERAHAEIGAALQKLLSPNLQAIYNKSALSLKGEEGSSPRLPEGLLFGTEVNHHITECGVKYRVDIEGGQKTGFFLDQRINRKLVREIAKGKRVLNCFSYSGGFSLSALLGGASEVCSVDSSPAAMALLEENLKLNGISDGHRSEVADCLPYLKELKDSYELLILDPPAFVKSRKALQGGIKGYESIHHHALHSLKPGAFLMTFSCSQLVTPEDFKDVILRAAERTGKRLQLVTQLHAAPCHPVLATHPEGEYLKGWLCRVM